jgi:hypothetical protein
VYIREPNKRRFINAVNHIEQEDVPFVETEIDFTVAEMVLGRKVPRGLRSYELSPKDYVTLLQRTGMDMAYLHVPWKLGRKEHIDADGRMHYVDGTIKTFSDLRKFEEPDMDVIKRRLDEMITVLDGTNIGTFYNIYNTPFIAITAVGYEDYYLALLTEPDFIKELFKRVEEVVVKQLEIVLSYPIDAVLLTNILCMNTGPIMRKEMMEEFEFPYLKRHIERARSKGVLVAYHCDGDNSLLCPDLIGMGVQVLQALEPCGNQNIYKLKKLYGNKVTLWGNIDVSLLATGTKGQIVKDVTDHIEKLSIGGGYICASSHDINEKIPIENFWTMAETVFSTKVKIIDNILKDKI